MNILMNENATYGKWTKFCNWREHYHYFNLSWNFRDIGDYPTVNGTKTKTGKIFRSSNLDFTSPKQVLALKKLGINRVIDLRNRINRNENGDFGESYGKVYGTNIKYKFAPIYGWHEIQKYGFDSVIYGQQAIHNPISINALRRVFDVLTNDDKSTVYQCDWGCDRTGMTSMFIEMVLGVKTNYIVDDYILTHHYASLCKNNPHMIAPNLRKYVKLIKVQRIIHLINSITKQYGSVIDYLKDKNIVNDNQIKILRHKYTC